MENFIQETRKNWEMVKDLRNKIFAHQDVMDDIKREGIFEQSKYAVFDVTRLLTVKNILWQAYHNGQKPDFEYVNKKVGDAVPYDMALLLEKLSSAESWPEMIRHNKG